LSESPDPGRESEILSIFFYKNRNRAIYVPARGTEPASCETPAGGRKERGIFLFFPP
jgi:hypothetical protein